MRRLAIFSFCVMTCLATVAALAEGPAWPDDTTPTVIRPAGGGAPQQLESRKGESGFRALYSISPKGGDAEFFLAAPGSIINTDPQFSHDGKFVVFSGFPKVHGNMEAKVLVAALDRPYKGTILDYGSGIESSWTPDHPQIASAALGQTPP